MQLVYEMLFSGNNKKKQTNKKLKTYNVLSAEFAQRVLKRLKSAYPT